MNRWGLAGFALAVTAAALALVLTAATAYHRCCTEQEVIRITEPPRVVEVLLTQPPLPTYTPAPIPTGRTIVVYQPTVVEVEVTRIATREGKGQ